MTFSGNKMDVARFVAAMLIASKHDLPLITITVLGSSEDCSVSIATSTWSEDIVKKAAQNYCLQLTNI
jgi:hypothetical protein